MAADYEPYIDADTVAEFLKVKRKTVLEWAREGPCQPTRGVRDGESCGVF